MSIEEIKNTVDGLGKAWEEFKRVNDDRLKAVEAKKSDPLYDGQLDRINNALDEYKSKMAKLEAAIARPDAAASLDEKKASAEYKEKFSQYLRKGVNTEYLEQKSLSSGVDPDGGYLVLPEMSATIVKSVFESSPVRAVASVQTISTDSLDVLNDVNQVASGWTTEQGAISETDTPRIGKSNIPTHEMFAEPRATQKVLDDAFIDLEGWLSTKIAEKFTRDEATAFVSGNGVGRPRGFLTYAHGTSWGQVEQVASGTSGAVTADGLISLYYALKEPYAANASWMMARGTVRAVRLLKENTTNQYIWQPGLQAGQPDLLLSAPVFMASDMPAVGADALSVAVGDFRQGYQVVDRNGIRILRDPFTAKPFVKFYATRRVGGDVVNFEAIKLLKLSTSV